MRKKDAEKARYPNLAKNDTWLVANGWPHLVSDKLFAFELTEAETAEVAALRKALQSRTYIRSATIQQTEYVARRVSYWSHTHARWVTRVETLAVELGAVVDDVSEDRMQRRRITRLLTRQAHGDELWARRAAVLKARRKDAETRNSAVDRPVKRNTEKPEPIRGVQPETARQGSGLVSAIEWSRKHGHGHERGNRKAAR